MSRPPFVGPHEGVELKLMLEGKKPLAMFFEPSNPEFEYFPESDFDEEVRQGRFVKNVFNDTIMRDGISIGKMRRVLYARLDDTWRIKAMTMLQELYSSLSLGDHYDLDRAIGLLLGYDRKDIEDYVAWRLGRASS